KITNHPDQFSDAEFPTNHSYIYQAQTELGSPDINFSYIASQLEHPYTMEQYLPPGVTTSYTPAAMLDIKEWVKKNADRIMFVYGEFDPYTAGAFRKINNKPGTDNHWYLIRGGNHIVDYHDL